jgi:arsenate reductase (glutaredoxin)
MYTVYGIPNCDTVKKVLVWLQLHNIAYTFYNFKTAGIPPTLSKQWIDQKGLDTIVNKKSTTYKELPPKSLSALATIETALPIIEQYTSIVKRPIITKGNTIVAVGFKEKEYEEIFG